MSSSASLRRARGRDGWIAGGLIILALGAMAPAGAGGGSTQTGAFADTEPGARGAALAGAYAPLVDDPTALHWNPSRLAEIDTPRRSIPRFGLVASPGRTGITHRNGGSPPR